MRKKPDPSTVALVVRELYTPAAKEEGFYLDSPADWKSINGEPVLIVARLPRTYGESMAYHRIKRRRNPKRQAKAIERAYNQAKKLLDAPA